MTEQAQNMLGRQLGNYTLTRLLGKGGFAEVYLGIHKHLETQAAIKVLLARLSQADQESFLAEARTVARLRHPHIVHILEFGIEDDTPYLVMNFATHGTLRHHFPRGVPLAPETILPYLKQIASALQYAHDQQLIHRDIKPENMLLDEQNMVFLSDFGIATQARSSRSQTMEEVIGTVVYMAPEQLQGRPRPASDQYSLAIVVYEWLCGTRPFQGSNYITIASQHISSPPPSLHAHVPTLPLALEQVVLSALAKDHHQRYARVTDFVEALEQAYLSGRYLSPQDFAHRTPAPASSAFSTRPMLPIAQPLEPTLLPGPLPAQYASTATQPSTPTHLPTAPTAPLARSAFSRRALLGGGAAAMLLAGGVTWWAVSHQHSQATGSGTSATQSFKGVYLPQAHLIYTCAYKTDVASVAWSPDGAYVASVEGNKKLSIWHAQTGGLVHQISMPTFISQLDWSADGRRLAVCAGNALIYNASTWQLAATSSFSCEGLGWSPDGQTLAAFALDMETQVALWDGINGHAPSATLAGFDTVVSLAWKSDGKQLAVSTTSADGAFCSVLLWNGGKEKPPLFTPKSNGEISTSWSSASDHHIATAGSGLVETWDAATLGQAYDKTSSLFCSPACWSPDGRFLASPTPDDHTIHVWNGTTFGTVSICQGHIDVITALAWSRDGNYLASTSKDRTVRVWQVRE